MNDEAGNKVSLQCFHHKTTTFTHYLIHLITRTLAYFERLYEHL